MDQRHRHHLYFHWRLLTAESQRTRTHNRTNRLQKKFFPMKTNRRMHTCVQRDLQSLYIVTKVYTEVAMMSVSAASTGATLRAQSLIIGVLRMMSQAVLSLPTWRSIAMIFFAVSAGFLSRVLNNGRRMSPYYDCTPYCKCLGGKRCSLWLNWPRWLIRFFREVVSGLTFRVREGSKEVQQAPYCRRKTSLSTIVLRDPMEAHCSSRRPHF